MQSLTKVADQLKDWFGIAQKVEGGVLVFAGVSLMVFGWQVKWVIAGFIIGLGIRKMVS